MNSTSRAAAAALILSVSSLSFGAEPAKSTAASAMDLAANGAAMLKASGLTPSQLLGGTKTGLGSILDFAADELAKPNAVQVGMPGSMAKLESLAKKAGQSGPIDSFKSSLTAAAASVMPQTTAVMKTTLAGLTIDDAMALTSNAPDSATKLLRKVSENALRAKLMPLVAQAIAANGTAAKAKELAAKAGPMAAMLGVPNASDLENYLFTQVMDTSFAYVAKGEAAVRANPGMLKDAVAAKVFGLAKK
ncbi:MAG: DUF4197 family protein [Verrucomicrobia bacterium]|nr:DUF4197 family protein [Verrucomicrobiota bacterium]